MNPIETVSQAGRPATPPHPGPVGEHPHAIEVLVNFKPVRLTQPEETGLQIKETAIAQGVQIKPDFVLFEVLPHDRRELIRDDQTVHVRPGERFEAVPGDDNS